MRLYRYPQRRGKGFITAVAAFVVVAFLATAIAEIYPKPPELHLEGCDPRPAALAISDIPAKYLTLYRVHGANTVCWPLLAGIGKVESNHGRSNLPGVHDDGSHRNVNNGAHCCVGPMQFNIVNGPPSTWDRWGDGNPAHAYIPKYAIPAAARMLDGDGGVGNLYAAIRSYNDADWYVNQVISKAGEYMGKNLTGSAADKVAQYVKAITGE